MSGAIDHEAACHAAILTSATDGSGTVSQGGHATVDLRLGYRVNKNLSASINVTNLFDRLTTSPLQIQEVSSMAIP